MNRTNADLPENTGTSRRDFIKQSSAIGAGMAILSASKANPVVSSETLSFAEPGMQTVKLILNGKAKTIEVDTRTTLLDALREYLHLTGTKKGCDRGQCGACTVLVNDRRINSCLTLAVMCEGAKVTTIEGIGTEEKLHPMQQAFLKHDAFQCGYCTPGQICSAVAMLKEGHAKSDPEIKEAMSGNLCRCGAYDNILAAIKEVQQTA